MDEKKPFRVSLYAAEGGKARAGALTREQRREIARAAAEARWLREGRVVPVRATYGGPLKIGAIQISCYVLADGRRVLGHRGFLKALGISRSRGKAGTRQLVMFLLNLASKGLQVTDLITRINNDPVRFILPDGGNIAKGVEAAILPEICEIVLKAWEQRLLPAHQSHIAKRCRVFGRAFSKVGIVVSIDKATGYHDVLARDALVKALEAGLPKELRKWVRTFPAEFYKEMFRLKGWAFSSASPARPQVGRLVNNLVYERLAPDVRKELTGATPREDKSRLQIHLHRRLAEDTGHLRLREHLAALVALMKASTSWDQFNRAVDRALPVYGETVPLPVESAEETA